MTITKIETIASFLRCLISNVPPFWQLYPVFVILIKHCVHITEYIKNNEYQDPQIFLFDHIFPNSPIISPFCTCHHICAPLFLSRHLTSPYCPIPCPVPSHPVPSRLAFPCHPIPSCPVRSLPCHLIPFLGLFSCVYLSSLRP